MNIAFLLTPKSAVAFIYSKSTFRQGLEKMRHHGYTALPVLDENGKYVGTIREGDFLWSLVEVGGASMNECEELCICDMLSVSRNAPVKITADSDELFERMLSQNFVPVVDDEGSFIGIVTRKSVLEHMRRTLMEKTDN